MRKSLDDFYQLNLLESAAYQGGPDVIFDEDDFTSFNRASVDFMFLTDVGARSIATFQSAPPSTPLFMTPPAVFELSSLLAANGGDGSTGFVINGIVTGDASGFYVSDAGDINGDGFDDFIIGAPGADPNVNNFAGESYLVFGSGTGFAPSLELSALNGTNGFVINGVNADDQSGGSVSGAGDINGDGFDDILIGAGRASPNGIGGAGESYVIFGSNAGFGASLELSALNGTNGFVINGIDAVDSSGGSVSAAGDVNGDGFDDILIGATGADPGGNGNAGESYVIFGSNAGFAASLELSGLNGTNGFVINGIDPLDQSGISVAGAGDINGDGFDDILIGASRADPNGNTLSGESYVIFGRNAGFAASLDLSALNGTNGFVINGIDEYDDSGEFVSSAGDINGDGFDDILIGATNAYPNGNGYAGETYVVFGSDSGFSASLNLSSLDGTNGFVINGIDDNDYSGTSVSAAGDINGDGFDDILIGADGADPNSNSSAGESYIVFGSSTSFGASLDLSTLNGTNGLVINGIDSLDSSGFSVSAAGDINGDGFDDILIGAYRADPNGDGSGESYIVFGSADFGPQANGNAPVTSGIEGAAFTYQETGGAQLITSTLALSDPDDTDLESASVAITSGFDMANDSLLFTDQNGIMGSYAAATGILTLTGTSSLANYQAALRSVEYLNLFDTESTAARTFTFTVNDGVDDSNTQSRVFEFNVDETFTGNASADTIAGGFGSDIISGLAGNDRLFGQAGNDTLNGGSGNDQLWGQGGADVLDGGTGTDGAYYISSAAGVTLNTVTGGTGGDAAGDSYISIERFFGSQFGDALTGGASNDFLYGLSGDDTLNGLGGNDLLVGGIGNDTINGGDGNDRMLGAQGDDVLNGDAGEDNISGGSGMDTINGGADNDLIRGNTDIDTLNGDGGNDRLFGGDGNDMIFGGAGNDLLWGDGGADSLMGGAGIDAALYSTSASGVTASLASGGTAGDANGDSFTDVENLYGSNFNDTLSGDEMDNSLVGLDGNDVLSGNGGNDRLVGGDGADSLEGGNGDDILIGQGGADNYLYSSASFGFDRIISWEDGVDLIEFRNYLEIADVNDLIITQTGSTVRIEAVDAAIDGTIIVIGATASDFTAADFIFTEPAVTQEPLKDEVYTSEPLSYEEDVSVAAGFIDIDYGFIA